MVEQLALWALGKLLPWAIERAWQRRGGTPFCVICRDVAQPDKSHMCSFCSNGIKGLTKK